jgi:hypothetical protein
MSTIKTLALAAFAAMSVGVGAAMAQEGGPSMPDANANYGSIARYHALLAQTRTAPDAVQSGSSDASPHHWWDGSGAATASPYYDQQ